MNNRMGPYNATNIEQNIMAKRERSRSPPRPAYSPFTPTLSEANLGTAESFTLPPPEDWNSQWIEEPRSEPVNLDENPDAIALRAAIEALQSQREKSLSDIKDLDRIKKGAKENPEGFLAKIRAGGLSTTERGQKQNETESSAPKDSDLNPFPIAQDIVRCPPIEWSKYHIVGEPLEQMHNHQRRRPGSIHDNENQTGDRVISAPYRPFSDPLNQAKASK